jgi:oxygen-independent coproporphyrinogen-3 oxidase
MNTCYSIYIHVPFCRQRCNYCDFNTFAGMEYLIDAYVDALVQEISLVSTACGSRLPVHTIYFGGGTPSLLSISHYKRILESLHEGFDLQNQLEQSLEANPGTVSRRYLTELHSLGFNRISFGMQSAHPHDLEILGRIHTYPDVIQAVKWARQSGFDNLNLDLIFGLPDQTIDQWLSSLKLAVDLYPEHFSIYSLTIEPNTPMHQWFMKGIITEPDSDLAADHYEWTMDFLDSQGYKQYEISNWARYNVPGQFFFCQHNLQYWRNLPYLGFGSGAHGYAEGIRTANVTGIVDYIQQVKQKHPLRFPLSSANLSAIPINPHEEIKETMMVGLRLTEEGVSRATFLNRFKVELESLYKTEIEELLDKGLLEWGGEDNNHLRLTRRGRLLGNLVFMRFVGD